MHKFLLGLLQEYLYGRVPDGDKNFCHWRQCQSFAQAINLENRHGAQLEFLQVFGDAWRQ
jgi:hypothetical protein